MINNITLPHTPVQPSRNQNSKQAPMAQAPTSKGDTLRFGQYKPKREADAKYYEGRGLETLDEADELKIEGKNYLEDARRYAREAEKEKDLVEDRIAAYRYFEEKAKHAVSFRIQQKNMEEALRKKQSAFFHMDTADIDTNKARQYKDIGLYKLEEADVLYSEGEELLDKAKLLQRTERPRYTSTRRHSEPFTSQPFGFSQTQPGRSQTQDSYFRSTAETTFYYPKPAPPKPQPQRTKSSSHSYGSKSTGAHGMHRNKSNPIPASYEPHYSPQYDYPESSHTPKGYHIPRPSFFTPPIFEEPAPQADWEYIPPDESYFDMPFTNRETPKHQVPQFSMPQYQPEKSSSTSSNREPKGKEPETRPFEMPHRFKPTSKDQPESRSVPKGEPTPGVKRPSTFSEGSTQPKFQPDEPTGHKFTPPNRSNTAPANSSANDKKSQKKENVRTYTAEEMKRDEELLRQKARAEKWVFQDITSEAERQRESNYTNLTWRLENRDEVQKFFDTINLPKKQRNFQNRKAFNTAYKKYLLTHQKFINDTQQDKHQESLERYKQMTAFKGDLETYMGWFGEPLAELGAWESQDEKKRKPGDELTGSKRFQYYTAAEANILREREEMAKPKPLGKPEKKRGHFRRYRWF